MSSFDQAADRINAAVEKAEIGSDILFQVANGDAATEVETTSGPVPSLKKWQKDNMDLISGGVIARVDKAILSYPDYAAASAAAATLSDGQIVRALDKEYVVSAGVLVYRREVLTKTSSNWVENAGNGTKVLGLLAPTVAGQSSRIFQQAAYDVQGKRMYLTRTYSGDSNAPNTPELMTIEEFEYDGYTGNHSPLSRSTPSEVLSHQGFAVVRTRNGARWFLTNGGTSLANYGAYITRFQYVSGGAPSAMVDLKVFPTDGTFDLAWGNRTLCVSPDNSLVFVAGRRVVDNAAIVRVFKLSPMLYASTGTDYSNSYLWEFPITLVPPLAFQSIGSDGEFIYALHSRNNAGSAPLDVTSRMDVYTHAGLPVSTDTFVRVGMGDANTLGGTNGGEYVWEPESVFWLPGTIGTGTVAVLAALSRDSVADTARVHGIYTSQQDALIRGERVYSNMGIYQSGANSVALHNSAGQMALVQPGTIRIGGLSTQIVPAAPEMAAVSEGGMLLRSQTLGRAVSATAYLMAYNASTSPSAAALAPGSFTITFDPNGTNAWKNFVLYNGAAYSPDSISLGTATYRFTAAWLAGLNLTLGTAPASAGATGTEGTVRVTTDHIYICTAPNTWKRAALTTW